jgi:hypothetical protein
LGRWDAWLDAVFSAVLGGHCRQRKMDWEESGIGEGRWVLYIWRRCSKWQVKGRASFGE